jgi:hypothetical protein
MTLNQQRGGSGWNCEERREREREAGSVKETESELIELYLV